MARSTSDPHAIEHLRRLSQAAGGRVVITLPNGQQFTGVITGSRHGNNAHEALAGRAPWSYYGAITLASDDGEEREFDLLDVSQITLIREKA